MVGTGGDRPGAAALADRRASPAVSRMVIGTRLRRLRETRGLSVDEAGLAIQASPAAISGMERGRTRFRLRDVVDLCALYGVSDQAERTTLLGLAQWANSPEWWHPYRDLIPGWFERYLSLEQAATLIRSFHTQVIPGLLQTPGYARGAIAAGHRGASPREISLRVELQLARQALLHQLRKPCLWMMIDEAALRRPVGGRAAMRAQLEYLIEACDIPGVTIGVLPFHLGAHCAAGGPIALLRLPDPQLPDVTYLEHLATALYYDDPGHVDYYWHAMNQLAIQADAAGPAQPILSRILRET